MNLNKFINNINFIITEIINKFKCIQKKIKLSETIMKKIEQ